MPDRVEVEAGKYLDGQRRQLFVAMTTIERWCEEGYTGGMMLTHISVQTPAQTGSDYRASLKGIDEGGRKWYAFVNGNSLTDLHKAIARVGSEKGFTWREDKPRE